MNKNISILKKFSRIAYDFVDSDADLKSDLQYVVQSLRETIQCEAVAIRLEKDGDYPYYVHDGFPEKFIERESSLLIADKMGKPIPCADGCGYLLDCMCGRVIRGQTDSSKQFFTDYGTFYSNNTTELLKTTTQKERGGNTRNYCNACGYESVLLTPLMHRGDTLGLFQMNDHRKNIFTLSTIACLEMLGDIISMTVRHKKLVQDIKEKLPSRDENTSKTLLMCSKCKAVKLTSGNWRPIEMFIKEITDYKFSHTYCSCCEVDALNNNIITSSVNRK